MARKIQFRRGTAASWTSTDPTLAIGELGLETDTGKIKIGDGVTAWSARPYIDAAALAHIADTSAAHAAASIASTPAGTLAATDVQAALNELDTEKAPLASPALTGTPTAPTAATATNTTQVATTAFVRANRAEQAAADISQFLAATKTLRPVATRNQQLTFGDSSKNLSDGTVTLATARLLHTCLVAATGIRLMFTNFYNNAGSEADGANAITVRASIEYKTGYRQPVFFNGSRSCVVEPGAVRLSDPIGITIPAGATFRTVTSVRVNSGETFPTGCYTVSGSGEGVITGVDYVDSGTVTASSTYAYAPIILGEPIATSTGAVLVGIGDSIMAGIGDNETGTPDYGWLIRAFQSTSSLINLAQGQAQALAWFTASDTDQSGVRRRLAMLDRIGGPKVAIYGLGVNDHAGGASFATLQGRAQGAFAYLASLGFTRIYATTITPYTTSTDSWATVGNQTVAITDTPRTQYNDWIRTTPTNLTGFIDTAAAVESATNSGLWKAAYTGDGIHPSATGHAAIAAAITPSNYGVTL